MMTKEDVLEKVGFDVEFKRIATEDGKVFETRQAIVRTDTKKPISIVSDKYRLIKHNDVLKEPLTILDAKGFNARSCYVQGDGEKIGVGLLSLSDIPIHDDKFRIKINLYNSYDATSALRMELGFFRLRCANGAGVWAGKPFKAHVKHKGDAPINFERDLQDAIEEFQGYVGMYEKFLRGLDTYRISSEDDAIAILDKLEYGPVMVKKILSEWRKDINYAPSLLGLYNGVTSLYSRKTEESSNQVNSMANEIAETAEVMRRWQHVN